MKERIGVEYILDYHGDTNVWNPAALLFEWLRIFWINDYLRKM